MWRACIGIVLLTSGAIAEELSPKPPASVAAIPQPEKTFEIEGPEKALRVSFDDLELRKLLDFQKIPVDVEDRLPEWLKKLDGKTVRVRGWMFPPATESELPAFLFVKTGMWMDFGRQLHADEKMGVRMRKGVTADYIPNRPFDVIGKFTIKSRVQDEELVWLYKIDDAVVIDQPEAHPQDTDTGKDH